MTTDIKAELERKLDPRRFTAMSGKMAAIVAYIINAQSFRTDPRISSLTIDSSGGLVAGYWHGPLPGLSDDFIGLASDLDRNWRELLKAADLTPEELKLARKLRRDRVKDWRRQAVPA